MNSKIVVLATAVACLCSTSIYAADESTKISGLAFIDLTNLNATTTNKATGAEVDGATNGIGVDVTRFYIGVDHVFDDTWSANVTTDFQYSSALSSTELFIKKAYLQAKVSDALVFRAGSADMPWQPFAEGLYGYRFVGKVLTDLEGVATPTDWGVNANGKLADGVVSYSVSAVNGAGFKVTTRSKTMDIEGRLAVMPVNGLTLAVGGYSGKRGQETALDPAENTYTRVDALAAYVVERFRVGVEWYQAKNLNHVQQDGAANANGTIPSAAVIDTDKESATSIWAAYNVTKSTSLFARYDNETLNPSNTVAPVDENTNKYLQLGIAFNMRKGVDLAVAYKNTKADTNFGATSTKTNEIGVWAQVKY